MLTQDCVLGYVQPSLRDSPHDGRFHADALAPEVRTTDYS